MNDLAAQRCFNHARREAAARCTACGRYFCRECVAEHENRLLCAACLRKVVRLPLTQRRGFVGLVRVFQCVLGLMTVWFFFYLVGEGLLALPTSFHEGTLWRVHWLESE
jgi:hypothetical protein